MERRVCCLLFLTALFRVHRCRLVSLAIPGNRISTPSYACWFRLANLLSLRPPKSKSKSKTKTNSAVKISGVIQALNHFQQRASPYADRQFQDEVVTTTAAVTSVLTPIVSQFTNNPQITKPITYGNGNVRYQASIMLHGAVCKFRIVGAQGTGFLAGDFFNSVRLRLHISGSTYADNPDALGGGLDQWYDTGDVVRLLHDQTYNLPSTAFDSANGYNCPNVKTDQFYIPINIRLDFFSTNATATLWDTRKYDMILSWVSDSTVTPHPSLNTSIRLYYDLIQ